MGNGYEELLAQQVLAIDDDGSIRCKYEGTSFVVRWRGVERSIDRYALNCEAVLQDLMSTQLHSLVDESKLERRKHLIRQLDRLPLCPRDHQRRCIIYRKDEKVNGRALETT